MEAKVNDIEVVAGKWLVASSAGIFTSSDDGRSWQGGPVLGRTDFVSAQSSGGALVAATHTEILISVDEGANWRVIHLPVQINSARSLALTPEGSILVASKEGGLRTSDAGETWKHMSNGLPDRDLSSISYDNSARVLLVTSLATGVVFSSNDGGRTWLAIANLGYPLRQVRAVHGRLLAATLFDGVIAQQ